MASRAGLIFVLVLTLATPLFKAYPKEEEDHGVQIAAATSAETELWNLVSSLSSQELTALRPAGFNLKAWLQRKEKQLIRLSKKIDKVIRKALNDSNPYLPLILRHWLREHL
ncbi:unnamed protein product [Dibothriocephalus latus]|uniref:Uncharacterized protein n=1 Tax=Dibothriocephalus latus TaxID=60516 RepID=A0A3P7NSH2_DIBLA|nr:unnamed protein product [Dibothriocephalus latus]